MYKLRWISTLEKVFMYLVDPNTNSLLSSKQYDNFIDAINDIPNDISNVTLPNEWIKKDVAFKYKITVFDCGYELNYYQESFYNFLGITSTQAEQLAIILYKNKKVDFKTIEDVDLAYEFCEELFLDNLNFELTVTNV